MFEVRFLEAVLDEEPLLSEQLLALAEWMAQYYLAPLGEVLRGMLPLMAEVRRTVYYRITDLGRDVLAESVDGDDSQVLEIETWGTPKREAARASCSAEEQDLERRVLERLAAGEPVKVSTLRTATAATLPVLAGLVRKKWIARETAAAERDARRMERFAVLIPEARLPALTAEAAGDSGGAGGVRRRAAAGGVAAQGSAFVDAADAGAARAGAHRRAAGGVSPGRACSRRPAPFKLNEPQMEALASDGDGAGGVPALFAAWSDGVGEDGGLSGGDAAGAGSGAVVDSAGSGDWADAADGGAAGRRRLGRRWRCCTRR